MFSLSWLRERGLTRARPRGRMRVAKALALGGLIVTSLLQTGCRSGGFGSGSGCSLFSPCGFPARATSRIMQPFRKIGGGLGACGDGCGTPGCDAPVVYGDTVGVMAPGTVVGPAVPLGTPATIVPGSTVPSTVPPVDPPTSLEPLPEASPGAAPTRGGRTTPGLRQPTSSYESKRPVQNPGVDQVQSLVSSPNSRTTGNSTRNTARSADTDAGSVLDNLPPLDVPDVAADRGGNPPAAPASVKTQASGAAASPAPATPTPVTTSAPPHDPTGGRAEGEGGLRPPAVAAAPAPDVESQTNGALGISRFLSVDFKLAGGSAPSTIGLGWLAEKGYRTVLDLRDTSKIDPAFIGEAARRGLRYVSLPTDLSRLDRDQVDRFSAELALDAARPLYFFDDDGRASGALWYIRRVLTDKVGRDVARREAEDLGLSDAVAWKAVRDFVDERTGVKTAAPTPAGATNPAPAATPPAAPKQAQVVERSLALAPAPPSHVTAPLAVAPAPPRSAYSEAWKPLAALLVTGLSFRMAFIGRAAIPTILSRSRASLPAPAPRS